ncbi:TIGR03915 family putative DNA repair protein [Psychrobacter sp. N25K4-3-2]|jgi:probable DNA metabolism protein|uniref:TIGR03915 family putative DNA repair protein n=1 Tax=Psychrobacter sp. N25K4-3-2 TaxID=2785026 RepID=UPI00188CEA33|nr:TIGR03915 family putative DNA repair protein [Psychrobacter sp. N25K4-3-2]MBF4488648.1 TIGR03915 family putative DNA repair protein [Psychrobacter sp. N25K4-3-2]
MSQLMQSHDYIVGHLTPSIVLYEPSFEGWLSAVFYVYANRLQEDESLQLIAQDSYAPSLISEASSVATDEDHAERVLTKLHKLLGRSGMRNILWGFLSEKDNIGTTLFQVIKYAIDYPSRHIMEDLGNLSVLELVQTVKSVGREKHRMEAFVRFEHTTDDIYFARVEPDFNVLPLIGEHFRQRYQDQHWAIYDLTRNYGIYYDKSNSMPKRPAALQTITDLDDAVLRNPASIHSSDEQRYQRFWQGYFTNVNIKERKNPKLHKQYLPQRYWKYLSEKQVLPNAEHLRKRR